MHSAELLTDTFAYQPPAKALEGLSAADAERRFGSAPHSIAEIVAHMNFWQNWFLVRAQGQAVPMATHASEGWPEVPAGTWDALRAEFLAGLQRAVQLDSTAAINPPFEMPQMASYGVGDVLVHLAQHNAHHMGQVITLRQLMGLWPPPAGSWTW